MVNVSLSTIDATTYVTYYSITVQRNRHILFQSAINSTSSAVPPSSFVLGTGIIIGPINQGTVGVLGEPVIATVRSVFASLESSIPAFTVRSYSSPSGLSAPEIVPNNRPYGSTLDRSQIIPIRTNNSSELAYIMQKYKEGEGTSDNFSTPNKKIFASNVTNNVSNTQSTKIIIKSLVNNYGFKTKLRRF